MQEHRRLERNRNRLEECYGVFAEALQHVIEDMEHLGFRPRIQDAWRSPEQQLEAFNNGNSELKFGFHNVTGPNGQKESLAVDLLDDDAPLRPSKRYLLTLAAIAREHGLETGILWGLERAGRERVNNAIREHDFDATVKVGWDPCHVQITGMTSNQAKQGKRPTEDMLAREGSSPAAVRPRAARTLLVRGVTGPARSRVGEVVTYRATEFNFADPTLEEKASINWAVRSGEETIGEFPAAGDVLDFDVPSTLGGRTIRVMPFRNSPANRVSVVTRIAPSHETVESDDAGPSISHTPKMVRVDREGMRYFARLDGGPRFFVGSDVRYQGQRGLMNTRDESGSPYDPNDYRGRFGFWADFIYPTALCESKGYFQRLNTYDRARFTFGFFQHAAHTPNDNFVLLLRQLLELPLAAAYFPDLTLEHGAVHRVTDQGLVRLESSDSTENLMQYLNPSREVVDESEVVHAAKIVHWSLHDPAHRELQVAFTIAQMQKKMRQYDQRYQLDGVVDTVCLVVADIRHQGRAKSRHIIEALESHDTLGNLLCIGEDGFPDRIRTLREAIVAGEQEGILGTRRYDAATRDFVVL